jgi:hypothetical protein
MNSELAAGADNSPCWPVARPAAVSIMLETAAFFPLSAGYAE